MFDPNGTFVIDAITIGHTVLEVAEIINVIEKYQFKNIVEVGLWQGGLSYILIQTFRDINYVGIELDCNLLRPDARTAFTYPNTTLLCGDCFSESVARHIATLEGKKLIYCDGGNKAREMKHFKPLVFVSDIIMCHDYWDGNSKVLAVPNLKPEVSPEDVEIYRNDERFAELSFPRARLIGFMRTE